MHVSEEVIFDEMKKQKLDDRTPELAQLILYLQGRKKKCTKVPSIRMWEQCIDETINILNEVIGVKVFKTKTSQGYQLYVKNALEIQHETSDENCYSVGDRAKYGLLIAILMFIYMMRRPGSPNYDISENSLKSFLKEMGIDNNSCFGNQMDLNKLLGTAPTAEFISQGWLAFTKKTDESGCDSVTYHWGPRAKSVIDPMAVLRAYCTMDGSVPHHWRSHYQEAQNTPTQNG